MKLGTKCALVATLVLVSSVALANNLRENVLRQAALDAGLVPASATHVPVPEDLARVGQHLFESKLLSLDQETACASCHIDQFGSADGLPNAIGTEGRGIGAARLEYGGDIIPRNTLPFWGRGGKDFDVFFWDGKVDASSGAIRSQFAGEEPSLDALVVAVHLPPVEIGEMLMDSEDNTTLETETIATAQGVFERIAERIRHDDILGSALASATGLQIDQLKFVQIAEAIAAFIRANFRIKDTRFHEFVFSDGTLEENELTGGLIFYGKGNCAQCHSGAYFSDLRFHAIPFPQAGFGVNGFGIDYGRFNVTLRYEDRYRFRTPPLYNVMKTSPYSHSGSVADVRNAIRAHSDPLAIYDPSRMTGPQRVDFYERLRMWAVEPSSAVYLDEEELLDLIAFLGTLEYESEVAISVVD